MTQINRSHELTKKEPLVEPDRGGGHLVAMGPGQAQFESIIWNHHPVGPPPTEIGIGVRCITSRVADIGGDPRDPRVVLGM